MTMINFLWVENDQEVGRLRTKAPDKNTELGGV